MAFHFRYCKIVQYSQQYLHNCFSASRWIGDDIKKHITVDWYNKLSGKFEKIKKLEVAKPLRNLESQKQRNWRKPQKRLYLLPHLDLAENINLHDNYKETRVKNAKITSEDSPPISIGVPTPIETSEDSTDTTVIDFTFNM